VGVACAGALVVLAPRSLGSIRGVLCALIAGGALAIYIVMTRNLRDERLRTNLFYTAAGTFAALSLYVPQVWLTPTWHDLAVFSGIGVVGLVVLSALDLAVESAAFWVTAPFMLLEVVFNAIISWHRQHSILPRHVAIGVLIIVAVALPLSWPIAREYVKATVRPAPRDEKTA
jgi:drug/metabolite transporter (DMT)-like permease